MSEKLLKNKNMILTGCNRGIGKAILELAVKHGANVWACTRSYSEDFEKLTKQLSEEGQVWIKNIYFDLIEEQAVKTAIKEIIKEKKSIDILINNAGIAHGGFMNMTSMDTLQEVFQVNYFSNILMMQLVSRVMMKQRKGCIINMASVGGMETNPGYLAYGSSKAALIWATQSIAKELGAYNIRVNAVAPGLTDTEMGHYKSEEELEKTINRTSLKRMARPEEIAEAVMYLASEQSSFVTGHILRVDGGRL